MNNGIASPIVADCTRSGKGHVKAFDCTSVSVGRLDRLEDNTLCIHKAIERRSRRSPKSEAVAAWDAKWTYEELEDLSSQLASRLTSLDIGPESLVPFCFDKSAWAIVAILGVLKAGAAFVPLDPTYPIDRLRKIIIKPKPVLSYHLPRMRNCVADSSTKSSLSTVLLRRGYQPKPVIGLQWHQRMLHM